MTQVTIPRWVIRAFTNYADDLDQLSTCMAVSSIGGSLFISDRDLVIRRLDEMLSAHKTSMPEEIKNKVMNAAYTAEVINTLHKQAIVTLWSSLEAFVHDFLISWLENVPSALRNEEIGKVKVSISDFMEMSDEERRFAVLDGIKQNAKAPFKQGVNMFEVLLKPFGLSGVVDTDVRRDILELSNMRNVIVHKRGIADGRMVKACPWLNLKAGQALIVKPHRYQELALAVNKYVLTVQHRVTVHFTAAPPSAAPAATLEPVQAPAPDQPAP